MSADLLLRGNKNYNSLPTFQRGEEGAKTTNLHRLMKLGAFGLCLVGAVVSTHVFSSAANDSTQLSEKMSSIDYTVIDGQEAMTTADPESKALCLPDDYSFTYTGLAKGDMMSFNFGECDFPSVPTAVTGTVAHRHTETIDVISMTLKFDGKSGTSLESFKVIFAAYPDGSGVLLQESTATDATTVGMATVWTPEEMKAMSDENPSSPLMSYGSIACTNGPVLFAPTLSAHPTGSLRHKDTDTLQEWRGSYTSPSLAEGQYFETLLYGLRSKPEKKTHDNTVYEASSSVGEIPYYQLVTKEADGSYSADGPFLSAYLIEASETASCQDLIPTSQGSGGHDYLVLDDC